MGAIICVVTAAMRRHVPLGMKTQAYCRPWYVCLKAYYRKEEQLSRLHL